VPEATVTLRVPIPKQPTLACLERAIFTELQAAGRQLLAQAFCLIKPEVVTGARQRRRRRYLITRFGEIRFFRWQTRTEKGSHPRRCSSTSSTASSGSPRWVARDPERAARWWAWMTEHSLGAVGRSIERLTASGKVDPEAGRSLYGYLAKGVDAFHTYVRLQEEGHFPQMAPRGSGGHGVQRRSRGGTPLQAPGHSGTEGRLVRRPRPGAAEVKRRPPTAASDCQNSLATGSAYLRPFCSAGACVFAGQHTVYG